MTDGEAVIGILSPDIGKWGISWQITPIALIEAVASSDLAAAKRAFDAMLTMKKIDIAVIEAAVRG